jgi:hypothetical protein
VEEAIEPSTVELHEAIGHLLSEWATLERLVRDLYHCTDDRRVVMPTVKMVERFVPDVREFERIRRLRNGVVNGVEVVDSADLHDAANRLHEIVEAIIRSGQQDPRVTSAR